MLQPCSNPNCSVEFAIGASQCPACGTLAPQQNVIAEPPPRVWSVKQVVKSVVLTGLGAAPGAIWLANAGTTQSAVILGLGTLIGFCLSLPGVSVGNVMAGTVGAIALKNSPRFMHDEIVDTFFRDQDDVSKKEPEHRD
jgi:hypothetical protein